MCGIGKEIMFWALFLSQKMNKLKNIFLKYDCMVRFKKLVNVKYFHYL